MIGAHSHSEYCLIMIVISVVCAAGAVSVVVPAVEHAIMSGLVVLGLLGGLVAGLRLLTRCLRERREDREDEISAAAWQAARQPAAVA